MVAAADGWSQRDAQGTGLERRFLQMMAESPKPRCAGELAIGARIEEKSTRIPV